MKFSEYMALNEATDIQRLYKWLEFNVNDSYEYTDKNVYKFYSDMKSTSDTVKFTLQQGDIITILNKPRCIKINDNKTTWNTFCSVVPYSIIDHLKSVD